MNEGERKKDRIHKAFVVPFSYFAPQKPAIPLKIIVTNSLQKKKPNERPGALALLSWISCAQRRDFSAENPALGAPMARWRSWEKERGSAEFCLRPQGYAGETLDKSMTFSTLLAHNVQTSLLR